MSDLRFAVIGAGFWANYQTAAWQEIQGASCVAICDQDMEKACRLAKNFGIAKVYADANEMLTSEGIDFVDIVSNVASHAPLVELAATHHVGVICQKPMAESLEKCERLVELCQAAKIPFLIHENWRWQSALRQVKELLSAGTIGQPFRCRIDMISGFDVFANQPNLRTDKQFIIADLGCHLFDLARSYFGEVASVYCHALRVHQDIRGEDAATVLLKMESGVSVAVNMAYAETPLERECFPETLVFIEGNLGSIEVAPESIVRITTNAGTEVIDASPYLYSWVDSKYAVVHSSMVDCHRNLLRSLQGKTNAETTALDNLNTMRVVFAAYESAAQNQVLGNTLQSFNEDSRS